MGKTTRIARESVSVAAQLIGAGIFAMGLVAIIQERCLEALWFLVPMGIGVFLMACGQITQRHLHKENPVWETKWQKRLKWIILAVILLTLLLW